MIYSAKTNANGVASFNFKLNPDNYQLTDSLRDVRNIGHWGCGDLQLIIKSEKDIKIGEEFKVKLNDGAICAIRK